MDLLNLFNPSYLFAPTPGHDFAYRWVLGIFFVALFAISFWVKKWLAHRPQARFERGFFGGIPARMREFALLGLLFTFFRDQNVPYLGMRFLLLLVLLGILAYALWIYRNYKKNFAIHLVTVNTRKEEDKYRPKKKRKN